MRAQMDSDILNRVHCTRERKGVGESQILSEESDKGVKEPLAGYTEPDTSQKKAIESSIWGNLHLVLNIFIFKCTYICTLPKSVFVRISYKFPSIEVKKRQQKFPQDRFKHPVAWQRKHVGLGPRVLRLQVRVHSVIVCQQRRRPRIICGRRSQTLRVVFKVSDSNNNTLQLEGLELNFF